MGEQNKEIHFHIMHSMKGGCGKSTCALFKTLQLANKALAEQGEITGSDDAKVLFLDADFKGSAMQALLFRVQEDVLGRQNDKKITSDDETVKGVLARASTPLKKGGGLRHIIAIPNGYRAEDNLSRYLREANVPFSEIVQKTFSYMKGMQENRDLSEEGTGEIAENDILINGYIDFVLAAVDSDSKNRFRNDYGKIASGVFLYRMEGLIEQILYHSARSSADDERSEKLLGQYSNVVVDMPPGYDEYSDMLLNLLRKMATKEKKIKLYYYAVTTEDIGHMRLTIDNIQNMVKRRTKYKQFDEVNVILNSPFSGSAMFGDVAVAGIKSVLSENGRLYLNTHNASYHEYSIVNEKPEFALEKGTIVSSEEWS